MTKREDVVSNLAWEPWQPLFNSWLDDRLPDLPGVYRIRRVGHSNLDYIGQTGAGDMTLKKRIGMLRDVYKPMMPYRAPHTAGPALWALRHASDCEFEVSVAPIEGSISWREGLKCVSISLYREAHGASPTANFGRMPLGYQISSGNNAELSATGRKRRGGITDRQSPNHLMGIKPVGPLTGDPMASDWCGHIWSSWTALSVVEQHLAPDTTGLYRIRSAGEPGLLYIGRGRVRPGLVAYLRSLRDLTAQQATDFAGQIDCSWVLDSSWYAHQRRELQTDLIAAYILHTGNVPAYQFPN